MKYKKAIGLFAICVGGLILLTGCESETFIQQQATQLEDEGKVIQQEIQDEAVVLREKADGQEELAEQIMQDAENMNNRADALEEFADEKADYYEDAAALMKDTGQDFSDVDELGNIQPQ